MNSALDREALRQAVRSWSHLQFRLALERVVEVVPDGLLERLLADLAHVDPHRVQAGLQAPRLRERVEAHVAGTRQCKFRGELVQKNRYGEREPWQTAAWLAATFHLFDLLLDQARQEGNVDAQAGLRALVELVEEVDRREDDLVVFEEEGARGQL